MGQKHGHLNKSSLQTLKDLANIQLGDIHMRLEELWSEPGSSKGRLRDKDAFIRSFEFSTTVGERLFAALDYEHTGSVSCEQFACGLAALLNDSVEERCALVFHALDMRGNVTRDEVIAMATIIQRTLIALVSADGVPAPAGLESLNQSLRKAVEDAFQQYDAPGSGSLTHVQLQSWLEATPDVFDILFPFSLGVEEDKKEEEAKMAPDFIPLSLASSQTTDSNATMDEPPSSDPSLLPPTLDTLVPHAPATIKSPESPSFPGAHQHLVIPPDLDNVELNSVTPRGSVASVVPSEQEAFYSLTGGEVSREEVVLDMEGLGGREQATIETESPTPGTTEEPPFLSLAPPPSGGGANANPGDEIASVVRINMESPAAVTMAHDNVRTAPQDIVMATEDSHVPHVPIDPSSELASVPMDAQANCSTHPSSEDDPTGNSVSGMVDSRLPDACVLEGDDTCPLGGSDHVHAGVPMGEVGLTGPLPFPRVVPAGTLGEEGATMAGFSVVGHHTVEGMPSPEGYVVPSSQGGVPSSIEDGVPSPTQGRVPSPTQGGVPSPTQGGVPSPTQGGVPSPTQGGVSSPIDDVPSPIQGGVPSPEDAVFGHTMSLPLNSEGSDPRPSIVTIPATPTITSSTSDPVIPTEGSTNGGRSQQGGQEGGGDRVERRYSFHFQNDSQGTDVNKTHKRVRSMSQPSMMHPDYVADRTKEAIVTAWLPNPVVQGVLANRSSLSNNPITCPGLVARTVEGDALTEITKVAFPHMGRKPQLSVEHVSMDGAGLRRLVSAGCLSAALELTARVLSAHGQGFGSAGQPSVHTHKTMQMWSARISLLVHMRRYKEAEEELEPFKEMDNPDLYYQYHFHNYPDKCGSMVPFTLRLLHAQVPSYVNNHQLTVTRLCRLQFICGQLLSMVEAGNVPWLSDKLTPEYQDVARTIWSDRLMKVRFALANCFVAMQDYELAAEVFKSLAVQLPSLKADIYAGIGRIYLQGSSLAKAQEYFTLVQKMATEDQTKQALVKSNEALAYVFQGKWREAAESFQDVLDLQPDNMAAKNNRALCHVYQDNVKEAISVMEQLIRSSPAALLQPTLLSNLSELYDVRVNSQAKRLSLMPLLAEHAGDAFNISALSTR